MIQEEIYIAKLLDRLACRGRSIVLRHQEELISGASLRDKIFQYARVLRECGIGPGKLLGLFAPNKPDAIAIRYAGHVLGAATVYVSMPPTEAQRRALVDRLAPDLMVLFPETLGCLGPDVNIPFATVWSDHVKSRARLDVLAGLASKDPLDVSARISDLAVVASSGGSTGVPKGSCRSFATYSRMVSAPSPDDRVQLINGPLAYLSQVLVDNTLIGGGCVVLRDAFETSDTLAAIEREKITDLFLVEPQLSN